MSEISFKDFVCKFVGNLDIKEFPNHYIEDIHKITRQLAELRQLNGKEIDKKFNDNLEYRKNNIKASVEKQQKTRKQYEELLIKVTCWKPPTSKHAELKSRMIESIEDKIKWSSDSTLLSESLDRLSQEKVHIWFNNIIEELENQIEDYSSQYAESVIIITAKNLFKQQLIDSLKDVEY